MGVLFAMWTLVFSIPFLILCAGIGTIFLMLLICWGPRIRSRYLPAVITVLLIFTVVWLAISKARAIEAHGVLNLALLLPGLNIASNPLLPSKWISEGIISVATFEWKRGLMYLLLLVSTSSMVCVVLEWMGGRIFLRGWERSEGGSSSSTLPARAYERISSLLGFLPCDIRAMVAKDVACFVRNPVQWSQVVIFFGLLAVYFVNIRSFNYHLWPEKWRNIIACMNIFSVSAVVCSLASRFIYPQLSLEGHGFWIIGLAPTTPVRIVLAKFALAFVSLLPVSTGLMLLSSIMLDVSLEMRLTSIVLACAISLAVSGMSTGFGAIFLDLKQRNPTAIVSGFGGTLNLVLNLAFMLITIIPFAFIFYHYAMRHFSRVSFRYFMTGASAGLVVLTLIVTVVPLWLGIRSLKHREF
jgi:ABC-2 type transport system permease protein